MPMGVYKRTEQHNEKLRKHLNRLAEKRRGHGKDKAWPKVCRYCQKEYSAYHNRSIYCSKSCIDKNRYHNGSYGIRAKAGLAAKRVARYTSIGSCELCGVEYLSIRTIKELGSGMQNGAAVFMKDHIIPSARGGGDAPDNTRYLCWFCNMTRKDMDAKYDEAIKAAALAFWARLKTLYS